MTKSNLPTEEKPGTVRRAEGMHWGVLTVRRGWSPDQVEAARLELGLTREPTVDELEMLAENDALGRFTPDIAESKDNLLTTAGLTRIMSLIAGAGGQAADATHTLLGVGNSTTAANVADTALGASAGATNQYWMPMDATYPTVAGAVFTAKATWASANGNFTAGWQEWGIQITTSAAAEGAAAGAGILLNHKIASLGTKVSGAVWSLTVTITLS